MRKFAICLCLALAALVQPAWPQSTASALCPAKMPRYAVIKMNPRTDFLSANQRKVVNLLIQAADEMTAIFLRQCKTEGGKDGPGHGFYPPGLTKAELESYLAAHPKQKKELLDGYTVVRRSGDKLTTIPYSVVYKAELTKAAALLEQAAALADNASLKRFLKLRAQAFSTNDYFASEMAWMDVEGTPIEVAIGPYETYTDELYGRRRRSRPS